MVENVSALRGLNFCKHCLSVHHVTWKPPNFCQFKKRHNIMLYKKILRCLAPCEYGIMRITKEARAAREDKSDIMPDCVIEVGPPSKSK